MIGYSVKTLILCIRCCEPLFSSVMARNNDDRI